MKFRFLGRTIEIANRVNIDHFKHEKTLIGASYRKKDLKEFRVFKDMILYCIMPYDWLEIHFNFKSKKTKNTIEGE